VSAASSGCTGTPWRPSSHVSGNVLQTEAQTERWGEEGTGEGITNWTRDTKPMPRAQIEALQTRKLKNLVAWADAKVPWQSKRLRAAGVAARLDQEPGPTCVPHPMMTPRRVDAGPARSAALRADPGGSPEAGHPRTTARQHGPHLCTCHCRIRMLS